MMRKLLYSFLFFISKSFPRRLSTPSLGLLCVWMFFVSTYVFSQSAYIAQRGTSTTAQTANTSLTIDRPNGVVAGDVMLVNIAQIGSGALSNPISTGWTLISGANLGTTTRWGAVLYKIATTSEPTSYTFTLSSNITGGVGSIVAFTGVDVSGTDPFDVASPAIQTTNNSTNVNAAQISTVTNNAAVIMFGQVANSSPTWNDNAWQTATSPGALNELYDDRKTTGGNVSVGAAWAIKTNAGATGAGKATISSSQRNGGILVALRPYTYKSQIIGVNTGSTTWCPGETRNVSVTIKNIGTATWSDGPSRDFNIGIKWNTNGTSWADYNVRVDAENLAPGDSKTYNFSITASNNTGSYETPLAAGTNNLTFDVVYEAVAWYGNNNNGVGPGNSVYTTPNQTILAAPSNKTVAASTSTVCSGSATTITVASSELGVSYQLRNASNVNIGTPVAGTGGTISLPTGNLTANTTFNVLATSCTNSTQMSATPTVTISTLASGGSVGTYTFCIDNTNSQTTASTNAGQYALINVIKGFTYNFSVSNVFSGLNEYLTILDASNDAVITSNNGANGTSLNGWVSTLSGQIKLVLSAGANCANNGTAGGTMSINLVGLNNTQETQNEFGTNTWVGHIYNAGGSTPEPFTNANYAGYYNVSSETINEGFGGDAACFPVYSNGIQSANIYTEGFAVRYKMNSTKSGCYIVTITGDDGVRLSLNGTQIFDRWVQQSSTTYSNVLVRLTGNDNFVLDYYENAGSNVVGFSMVPFDSNANTITAPATINFCSGGDPAVIGGSLQYSSSDANLQNTQLNFQWQISTDGSPFTDIAGATGRTYDPPATTTSVNVVKRYKRVVTFSSTMPDVNGVKAGCTYADSNIVTITTSPGLPVLQSAATNGITTQCPSLTGQVYSVAATNALSYSWTVPTGWTITAGQGTNSITVTTGTAGQNGNIGVTATNACGTTAVKNLAVTVVASPNISSNPSTATQIVCINGTATALSVTATAGSGTISSYAWYSNTTNSNTGGTLVGTNATYTPSTTSVGTLYYYVVVTNSNGCSSTSAVSGAITVNPNPIANAGGALAAICQGATSAQMGGSVGGGATGGTWTGGAGTWANATNPATATYTAGVSESGNITLTLTTSGGSCGTATASKTITVNPKPTANAGGALAAICQGAISAQMGGSVGGGATGGTWTGGAGTWANATNPATATYTAGASESGNITLTLTSSGGSCGTASVTKTITVNQNPTANAGGALAAICQGAISAQMGGSVGGGATGGTWSGGAGTWTNATNPATATYTAGTSESGNITLTLTSSGGSCGTTFVTKTITVNQNPTVNAGGALAAICQGTASAQMGGSVGGGATGGTWSGGSGTWANATSPATATYTAGASESGNITLTLTTSGGSCGTASVTKTITVNQKPTAPSITKNNDAACNTLGSITLTGLSGNWTVNQTGAGIGTYSGTTSTLPIQNLIAGRYYFTVTDNGSGCTSNTVFIDINDISSSTTWNGSAWSNGNPDGSKSVIVSAVTPNQPFTTATPNISACSLTITAPSDVSIPSGVTLTISNKVTSNGKLVFESGSSLIQTTNVQNTGDIVYKRATSIRRFDLTYWSSPVTKVGGFTMHDFSPTTLGDKYFYFSPNSGWVTNMNGTMAMQVGNGYSIRGPQEFDTVTPSTFIGAFIGVPNNGDITVTSVVSDKFFLFGNPYPSAIDVAALWDANPNVLGALYFWTHVALPQKAPGDNTYRYSSNDYIVYTATGSIDVSGTNPRTFGGYIAAGQGFFARPKTTQIHFNNGMRKGASVNSDFYKTAKSNSIERNRIWLNMINAEGAFKQILVGYVEGATNNVDFNYDAPTMGGNSFVDFYSINETKKLTIQGRALPFDNTDVVPLGYKTTVQGDFTIGIDHGDGFFDKQEVYLEDKTTGKTTNLRNENYTFNTLVGTFTDRFVLRYTSKTLGTGDFENLESSVLVSVKNKVINIVSFKETIKEVNVFNIGAQLLYSKAKVNSQELQISNLHSSDQVLLIKITLENGSIITKKVIFSNLE
ncbi:MAG: T9SS sorting signal type C domain-containing protein [Flavobacterium sp.]|uniref:T9SS sorting signal type C domain-containing protein n=1 Tax=Flavobacterium sp. TaxID=239 RepID=UPI001AFF51E2|nr:T9SS sorting signal type C domain-containing protein [Flavobacterium sp.]MBO9582792.1 T9SS sorting signal type C domain-containing protein [Flavobacterium sp.]